MQQQAKGLTRRGRDDIYVQKWVIQPVKNRERFPLPHWETPEAACLDAVFVYVSSDGW